MSLRPNTIHRFLHLSMAAIASLHRVRRRRQSFIAQKLKALLQCRRFQFLQRFRQLLEPPHTLSQFSQLEQCSTDRTTTVEQPIHLLHDLPQLPQFREPLRDFLERFAFLRRQRLLYEKKPIVEQRRDLRLNPFVPFNRSFIRRVRRTSPLRPFRLGFLEVATNARHRLENRLVDFLQDVEDANLMFDAGKHVLDRFRIKIRTIRRDADEQEFSLRENVFERQKEFADIFLRRCTVEYLVRQSTELMVVDDGKNAKRPVVHFVDGDVSGEFLKGSVEVIGGRDEQASFFPPPPRPSFGSWRREQKRDGPARDASSLPGREVRLRRRRERQDRRRRWCNGLPERRCRSCQR